ncbi:MAG: hypothetical protein INR70_05360 [Parafilimonas terrae]|nr:hypothetical protein [Parafilimonas terrae]
MLSRLLAPVFLAGTLLMPALAHADCSEDLGALMKKRMAEVAALNSITKAHGGKLEPIAACPRLRSLAAAEGQVVAYMTKNKDWCSIPDDLISKMTDTRGKTASIAVKACDFAVKIKKMQQQQQQQQQQAASQPEQQVKLPTGPL